MKKENIVKFIFMLLGIAVIIIAAIYIGSLNTTKLEEEEFYQYFGGRKVEYTGTLEISRKNNGITSLKINDINIDLDSTPIYYKTEENKMLFPQDMAVVFPENQGLMEKIIHFSTINLEENIPYLQYENNKQSIENSFLFDGNDLYIFLEPTTIVIEDQTYELSPLSYVMVTYRQTVEIYEKASDTYEIIETTSRKCNSKNR